MLLLDNKNIKACTFNEEEKTWRYKGSEVVSHIYKPIVALTNIDDINRWLRKHDVKSFTILKDNSVDVHGDIKLSDKLTSLVKLPLNFNIVEEFINKVPDASPCVSYLMSLD